MPRPFGFSRANKVTLLSPGLLGLAAFALPHLYFLFIEDKQTYVGGKVAVNVDGGLKAKGHPIGATGVSMTVEIAKQLRGEAGERQVPDADVGLTHNVGGIGQYCFVHSGNAAG